MGHLPDNLVTGYSVAANVVAAIDATIAKSLLSEEKNIPLAAMPFQKFSPAVKTTWDSDFLYVESDGMPDHPMMVGITAWQQQVPIPQPYTGSNAWRIPLKPVPASSPMSARNNFFRGAIALAANGVPIFNPIKNDGRTDTLLAGELDQYGGHSGRADDYHYHIAPLHLQEALGESLPVAYALDGYAIYGLTEPDGSKINTLDQWNGHIGPGGDYHYHSSENYPYLNGGFYGEVVEHGGQVVPQPRAQGVRPYTRPLRGATISGWSKKDNHYSVEYRIGGRTGFVNYTLLDKGNVQFEFIDTVGKVTSESYEPRERDGRDGESRNVASGRDRRGDRENDRNPVPVPAKPNFILILIDDMGWRDMGFAGSGFIDTPNTDNLARNGVIFTQAYSSAPNCAPTRACLMSGQYTPRHGVFTVVDARHEPGSVHHKILAADSSPDLAADSFTIAEAFKEAGYATAMFGMWNLGRGNSGPTTPTGQGFDEFKQPRTLGFDKDAYMKDNGEYLTDAFTSEGIRFMRENRDKPFFLYLAYHAVHHPFQPKPDLLKKYQSKARSGDEKSNIEYAATVEALDQNMGRLQAALLELGLDRNTIVVFTSDNGGNRINVAPLNGSKGSLYEGGLRVPAAIWGTGIRKSVTSDVPFTTIDIYPTLIDLAGIPRPKQQLLDGTSFAQFLRGGEEPRRDTIFFHFPSYIGAGGPSSAMRKGNYKLIEQFESGKVELYDLSKDIGESRDIAKSSPELTRELYGELLAWQQSTGAPRPTQLNPNYDPGAQPLRGRENRGKGGGNRANREDGQNRQNRQDRNR